MTDAAIDDIREELSVLMEESAVSEERDHLKSILADRWVVSSSLSSFPAFLASVASLPVFPPHASGMVICSHLQS